MGLVEDEDEDEDDEAVDSLPSSEGIEVMGETLLDGPPREKFISLASTEYRRMLLSILRRLALCSKRVGAPWLLSISESRERRGVAVGEATLTFWR